MKHIGRDTLKDTLRAHRACVVIPTYNNAGTLARVVSETKCCCLDVIVVNDGSTDETREILRMIDGIDVVDYPDNKGKGGALKRGFKRAAERGFKYAITLDSDGQHYPEDIEAFAEAIAEHPGSLVVGQRDLSDVDINGRSSFANKFSNFWYWVQTGRMLRDTQTGFRAYPLDKLRGLSMLTGRYEAELELLVFASWHGVDIVSVPIRVYYPPQSERVSHFRPVSDFARISLLNTLLCVAAAVYGLPVRAYNAISRRKVFNRDFRCFTHRDGKRRDAAMTVGRIARSLYGMAYFMFWSMAVFTPMSYLFFAFGCQSESRKMKFHRMLQWISGFLTKRFPAATTVIDNRAEEHFDKPALVICNHQSHIDLPVIMSLSPKFVFLTNDWVWNNAFYGHIIHKAEFLPVSAGMDAILPQLRDLVRRGYSIVVFPEGTRSPDCSILRFRQGAFLLAKELGLDIVPMVLHGAGHYLPKNDFMFRTGNITLTVLPRRKSSECENFPTLRMEASSFRKLIKGEYALIAAGKEKSGYFKSLVLYKYAYRGWRIVSRCKRTLKALDSYKEHIDSVSKDVKSVRIIHAGIGVFPLLFALVNKDLEVYAFEENAEDYKVAAGTASLPDNLRYIHSVWSSDYEFGDMAFDRTIVLKSPAEERCLFPWYSPLIISVPS